jgi:hypothetical protein
LKSGSLNLLEPSGPVQACNGIALPFQCLVDEEEIGDVEKRNEIALYKVKMKTKLKKLTVKYLP